MDLVDKIPRAVYVADGGELPAQERHYLLHQGRYRDMAVAVLRQLADAQTQGRTDVDLGDVVELNDLADEIEKTRESPYSMG